MELAVNAAVSEAQAFVGRMRMLQSQGQFAGPADNKRRAAWCEYGYPAVVTPEMLYAIWSRGGYAFGAVKIIIDTCWQTSPEVVEGDDSTSKSTDMTEWDKAARKLFTPRMWHAFAEADRRRLVSKCSFIILRISDGKSLDHPVEKDKNNTLVEAVPIWRAAMDVKERDATTGAVKMWNYTYQNASGTGQTVVPVHPDRVFVLGDATDSAVGFLQPVYNNFVNLEKISGGSGESYLKNAGRQLHVNFNNTVPLDTIAKKHGVEPADLKKQFNAAVRDLNMGNDTVLVTQGADAVTPLVATVPDPESHAQINLQEVSCGLGIPQKILAGNQNGERASTEDRKEMNSRGQSRREKDLSFDISDLVAHCQNINLLAATNSFIVAWDDLNVPTRAERLANGKLMSDINEKFEHTGESCFSIAEVRVASGYEPKIAKA